MFRPMRRSKQALPDEEIQRILESCTDGVLAVAGDDGFPYAVPLNYVLADRTVYFHTAKEGHKVDAIRREPKVTFTVVEKRDIVEAELTTYFRSVIVFGNARIVTDPKEHQKALLALSNRLCPSASERVLAEELATSTHCYTVAIDILHATGKESIELVRAR